MTDQGRPLDTSAVEMRLVQRLAATTGADLLVRYHEQAERCGCTLCGRAAQVYHLAIQLQRARASER